MSAAPEDVAAWWGSVVVRMTPEERRLVHEMFVDWIADMRRIGSRAPLRLSQGGVGDQAPDDVRRQIAHLEASPPPRQLAAIEADEAEGRWQRIAAEHLRAALAPRSLP